jgi:hypothetical protein
MKRRIAMTLGTGFLIALALSNQADAYWRGGVWIEPAPPPYYYAPPPVVVAPPPTYYAPPPPVVYQPPPPAAMVPPRTGTAYGTMCFAGVYRCQLSAAAPLGSGCSCPGIGAPSYGTVR